MFCSGVDFTHSYWQFLWHPSSRVCQYYVTPDSGFSPTRVLHGTTNAEIQLQFFLSTNVPACLRDQVLLWVKNCLIHERTDDNLFLTLRQFFEFCVRYYWKLNRRKSSLYTTKAKWCGRFIFGKVFASTLRDAMASLRWNVQQLEVSSSNIYVPCCGCVLQFPNFSLLFVNFTGFSSTSMHMLGNKRNEFFHECA